MARRRVTDLCKPSIDVWHLRASQTEHSTLDCSLICRVRGRSRATVATRPLVRDREGEVIATHCNRPSIASVAAALANGENGGWVQTIGVDFYLKSIGIARLITDPHVTINTTHFGGVGRAATYQRERGSERCRGSKGHGDRMPAKAYVRYGSGADRHLGGESGRPMHNDQACESSWSATAMGWAGCGGGSPLRMLKRYVLFSGMWSCSMSARTGGPASKTSELSTLKWPLWGTKLSTC